MEAIPIPAYAAPETPYDRDSEVDATPAHDPAPAQADAWAQAAAGILADAERKAQQIVAEAMERAAAILDDAQENAAQRVRAAERDGWERGLAEGRKAAQAELEQAKSQLQAEIDAIARQLRADFTRRVQAQRQPMIHLITAALSRLLRRELELAPADIANIVDELLGQFVAASTVYVRVHPSDADAVREASPVLALRHGGTVAPQVVPDVSFKPGDCVIAADGVEIDARIEVRLDELARVLAEIAEDVHHGE